MKKIYSEVSYIVGLAVLALGTALMERADFGVSMVVAPAYLVYLKVSQYLAWFTFGMAEYCFQAVLIVLLCIVVKRFRKNYLFSFVTAVIYGVILDVMMKLISFIPGNGTPLRIAFFTVGMLFSALGVSLVFHTYIAPEAYELFVKEFSDRYNKNINNVKSVYDICSCLTAVVLSFIFFGLWHFEGIKVGTLITTLINGRIIGIFSKFLEKKFCFTDAFPWRKYFEK